MCPTGISFRKLSLHTIYQQAAHKNIEFSTVHHFAADSTNMLLVEKSLKKLNKHVNNMT